MKSVMIWKEGTAKDYANGESGLPTVSKNNNDTYIDQWLQSLNFIKCIGRVKL